jgi:hypothetical protein
MSRDFDVKLFYSALDQKRESLGLTWNGVAQEIANRYTKVATSTIKGIRGKKYIEGDGGLQMLLWLGKSPESFVPGAMVDSKHELIKPTNAVLRFDAKEVHRLLEARRLNEGLAWREVADQIGGVSVSMLRRFKNGGRTSFPIIMRVANWLDVPARKFTKENPW